MLKVAVKLLDLKDRMVNGTKQFFSKKEEGASGVEYGLLVALIAAIIVVAVKSIGTKISTGFTNVNTTLP
jgi:pilus assembly protein Flp/PilA